MSTATRPRSEQGGDDATAPGRGGLSSPISVAVCCDYPEERWISMDLVGEMLLAELANRATGSVVATAIRPSLPRRFGRLLSGTRGFNADRLAGRFLHYPRLVRSIAGGFDLFHIVDHSYAHLALALPPGRVVVTCHDLDAFRCLFDSTAKGGPLLGAMARRSLAGLRAAARVVCDTEAVRAELVDRGLIPIERMVVVPVGVHPALGALPSQDTEAELSALLGPTDAGTIDLLHVGSTIPRKRIDLLLETFAALRRRVGAPLRLLRVGGRLTPAQADLARRLGVDRDVIELPFLTPALLGAVYRRAAVALQPSDAEGFGLPVVEALACGTPVVASDIPVLREVGGDAAVYCPVGDVPRWVDEVARLVGERTADPERWAERRRRAIIQGTRFSWTRYAEWMAEIYEAVAADVPIARR